MKLKNSLAGVVAASLLATATVSAPAATAQSANSSTSSASSTSSTSSTGNTQVPDDVNPNFVAGTKGQSFTGSTMTDVLSIIAGVVGGIAALAALATALVPGVKEQILALVPGSSLASIDFSQLSAKLS